MSRYRNGTERERVLAESVPDPFLFRSFPVPIAFKPSRPITTIPTRSFKLSNYQDLKERTTMLSNLIERVGVAGILNEMGRYDWNT